MDLLALPEVCALWLAHREVPKADEGELDDRFVATRPCDFVPELWAGALTRSASTLSSRDDFRPVVQEHLVAGLRDDAPRESLLFVRLAECTLCWRARGGAPEPSLDEALAAARALVVRDLDGAQARVVAWAGVLAREGLRLREKLPPLVDRSPLFYALDRTPAADLEVRFQRVWSRLPVDHRTPAAEAVIRAVLAELPARP